MLARGRPWCRVGAGSSEFKRAPLLSLISWPPWPRFLVNFSQCLPYYLPRFHPPFFGPRGQYPFFHQKLCVVQTRASKINKVRDFFRACLFVILTNRADLVHCPGCGSAKLAHHLCPHCYSSINRAWKSKVTNYGSEVPS